MTSTSNRKCVHETDLDGRPLRVYERSAMTLIGAVPAKVPVQCFYEWEAPDWPMTRILKRIWFKRAFHKPTGLLFESDTFNRWFQVLSADEDFTIALLGPAMQEFLLTKTSVEWTLGGGVIKLFYGGGFRKDRLDGSLTRLRTMWSLVPEEMR
jgi:hypothetical protein